MEKEGLLKELLDEKIINVLKVFAKNPEKKFYLTELSKQTGVNISSNLRILRELVKSGFVNSKLIGRTRYYQLAEAQNTQKVLHLLGFEMPTQVEEPLKEFIEMVKTIGRIDQIILKSRTEKSVKLMLVGDYIPTERIEKLVEETKLKSDFDIHFVELKSKQYKKLLSFDESIQSGRIIYKKN
jgi:hypothetical protein